jgi:hypothetical protein
LQENNNNEKSTFLTYFFLSLSDSAAAISVAWHAQSSVEIEEEI